MNREKARKLADLEREIHAAMWEDAVEIAIDRLGNVTDEQRSEIKKRVKDLEAKL